MFILLAGLWDGSADHINYVDKYHEIIKGDHELIEVSFIFFSYLSYWILGNALVLFIIYAFIGVSLKFVAIKQLSNLWFLSIIIYLGNFYILQEMTQIRVGVATGFFLLSIKPIYERDWKKFLLFFGFAFLFHYSALIMLPLWFLPSKSNKIWLIVSIPIAYVIYFLGVDLFSISIPIPAIQEKLDIYNSLQGLGTDWMDEINVFNLVFLVKVVIFYFLLWKYDTIAKHNKYFPILMRVYCLSLFVFPALGAFPVAAFRVSEFYGIVEIILYPLLIYSTKPARYAVPVVVVLGGILLIISQQNLFVK